jgi:hypothetical protein
MRERSRLKSEIRNPQLPRPGAGPGAFSSRCRATSPCAVVYTARGAFYMRIVEIERDRKLEAARQLRRLPRQAAVQAGTATALEVN